ncbi:hypothetical protein [Streptomyces sp. NPDC005795]|uniref:hypothetical protein n=1 Tax=Streptomyces sp. NPDC005795 TaxID=3154677 RepID=UPI0033C628CF
MSYGYPPPQPDQQPQQPDPSPSEWQQPGRPPQADQPWQYPPQAGPGWGAPMPPPKKTNVGLIVGAGCGGLLLAIVIVGVMVALLRGNDDGRNSGSSSDRPSAVAPSAVEETPTEEEAPPRHVDAREDVTIKACSVNSLTKWPHADLEILNSGGDAADYIVYVEFVDSSGTRLAEGLAAATGLGPGQKAKEKAQGLGETSGKVSCKVTNVYRSAAS